MLASGVARVKEIDLMAQDEVLAKKAISSVPRSRTAVSTREKSLHENARGVAAGERSDERHGDDCPERFQLSQRSSSEKGRK